MTWEKPTDLQMCSANIIYHWWQIYPKPNGPCEKFATRWSVSNENYYCEECWYRFCQEQKSEKGAFSYKRVNGKAFNLFEMQTFTKNTNIAKSRGNSWL